MKLVDRHIRYLLGHSVPPARPSKVIGNAIALWWRWSGVFGANAPPDKSWRSIAVHPDARHRLPYTISRSVPAYMRARRCWRVLAPRCSRARSPCRSRLPGAAAVASKNTAVTPGMSSSLTMLSWPGRTRGETGNSEPLERDVSAPCQASRPHRSRDRIMAADLKNRQAAPSMAQFEVLAAGKKSK
jgi:hypothetical protein